MDLGRKLVLLVLVVSSFFPPSSPISTNTKEKNIHQQSLTPLLSPFPSSGLGHFGLLWAKALGADKVVAISRTRSKESDARKLGADDFIATSEDGWEKKHSNSLDLIISSVSSPKMPLEGYLSLLAFQGRYIQLGIPENPLPNFSAAALVMKRATMGGSLIGAPHEIEDMLKLAAEKKVQAWINLRPMKEANQAIVDFEAGKPRYRICLVN